MKKRLLIIFIAFVVFIFVAGIIFYSYGSRLDNTKSMEKLKITSPAFSNEEVIPDKYTCNGANVNPELDIEAIPAEAKSLALIVDDPDAPAGTWNHWIVFNIQPSNKIEENSVPGEEAMNDFKKTSYGGPCTPQGAGFHRYFFRVYALDARLSLSFATREDVELAMKDHILAKGELMGKFKRD